MSGLRRNETVSFGRIIESQVIGNPTLTPNDNPLSKAFNPPVGDSPGELSKYLLACQAKQYKQTILEIFPSQTILKRHMKLLLKKYDPLLIKRAIKYASLRCKYIYSIKIIMFYCERIPDYIK